MGGWNEGSGGKRGGGDKLVVMGWWLGATGEGGAGSESRLALNSGKAAVVIPLFPKPRLAARRIFASLP